MISTKNSIIERVYNRCGYPITEVTAVANYDAEKLFEFMRKRGTYFKQRMYKARR